MKNAQHNDIGHPQYIKNEYRSSLLCIDSYEDKTLMGRIYNQYMDEGRSFENVMQFLILSQELFDMMDYPQPFTSTRKFWENPCITEKSVSGDATLRNTPPHGKLATFHLKVIFRQNASWQGSLAWLDQNKEESFRSVLELLMLLDEAISS